MLKTLKAEYQQNSCVGLLIGCALQIIDALPTGARALVRMERTGVAEFLETE